MPHPDEGAPAPPTEAPASYRAAGIAGVASYRRINDFLTTSVYARRRDEPGVCDFALGNPHDMPSEQYVSAYREALTPRNEAWYAYKTNEPAAREAAAASLERHLGIGFHAEDLYLTTGGFTAIAMALKAIADPGDEVIYSLPPWFCYEPLITEAALVPAKVKINTDTFDVDLAAIAAAITSRTRAVIVNSPNNPTGRIYPPELLTALAALLEEASARIGRRIYLISDEAYNRIVFDGARFHSPAEFYPYTLVAYTYGKTHLAPGERIGYLALPAAMPVRSQLADALAALQLAMGWIYPNAVLQHALPALERFTIDIGALERKRDLMVEALSGMGYRIRKTEGSFYLYIPSPGPDDMAFTEEVGADGVLVMPGALFETPGFFRVSLTASEDMVRRSLPVFEEALRRHR
jgi:aspartate aminotransferase